MKLGRHAAVLWRFRAVTAGGVLLGIVLAVLAAYSVSWNGGPSLTPRGAETWSSDSSLLVTQPGFPEGRVILPTTPPEELASGAGSEASRTTRNSGAAGDKGGSSRPEDQIEFADPNRFIGLADVYSQLAMSDLVRRRIPERPSPGQIVATPVQGMSGTPVLPIIKLTTSATSGDGARTLNDHTVKALREHVAAEQDDNDIAASQRVQLPLLNAPSQPVMTAGRSHTASILALLLCTIGAVAVAHILAALRPRPEPLPDEFDAVFDAWDVEAMERRGSGGIDAGSQNGAAEEPAERHSLPGQRTRQ